VEAEHRQLASGRRELGHQAPQEELLTRPETATVELPTGATARITGALGSPAVVCVNGGSGREVPGDWSATLEWLVERLSRRFPGLVFVEVRYRVKSWRRLDLCVEDGAAALELASAGRNACALLGFSMGGAVAVSNASHPAVTTVIGLAPWLPEQLDVRPLEGKRITVVHGSLDGAIPGVPGVRPGHTLRGLERIRARGVEVEHTLLGGGLHGVAVHAPWGGLVALPRARHWLELVSAEVERFRDEAGAQT
jgi:pimeloyl-ACP methyl ester carboxylesterase